MAYLNSDDILLPGSLQYVAQYFQTHPKVDVIYAHRILINTNDLEIGRWILPPHDDHIIQWADYVPQETLFWRRRIWDKIGGYFDESFQYAMDWNLIVRFIQEKAKMVRVPAFLGAFRVHSAQKTIASLSRGELEVNQIRKSIFGYEPSMAEVYKKIQFYLLKASILELLWKKGLVKFQLQ
jgi:hypothetical protein